MRTPAGLRRQSGGRLWTSQLAFGEQTALPLDHQLLARPQFPDLGNGKCHLSPRAAAKLRRDRSCVAHSRCSAKESKAKGCRNEAGIHLLVRDPEIQTGLLTTSTSPKGKQRCRGWKGPGASQAGAVEDGGCLLRPQLVHSLRPSPPHCWLLRGRWILSLPSPALPRVSKAGTGEDAFGDPSMPPGHWSPGCRARGCWVDPTGIPRALIFSMGLLTHTHLSHQPCPCP